MNTHKQLTRSDDRIIAGVLAGFAEFFDIDPTLMRVGFVALAILIAGFPALALYGVCWLIIPSKHGRSIVEEKMNEKKQPPHSETVSHESSPSEPKKDEAKSEESKTSDDHQGDPRVD